MNELSTTCVLDIQECKQGCVSVGPLSCATVMRCPRKNVGTVVVICV